jgi:uncharacterized protein (TIGR03435 family)
MRKPPVALAVVMLFSLEHAVLTQVPPAPTPSFDVATIRPSKNNSTAIYQDLTRSGIYTARNVTVRHLIREAHPIRSKLQLVGGPDWADTAIFDISAKTEAEPPSYRRLLQGLLAERFKLVLHTETRVLPVYALMMAKVDGYGPRFRRASGCDVKNAPAGPNQLPTCGARYGPGLQSVGDGQVANLIVNLPHELGRVVVDRTGLAGKFDWDLRWEVDQTAATTGPSIFAALQEQLGLKLEPSNAPLEVFVIDNVEKPDLD